MRPLGVTAAQLMQVARALVRLIGPHELADRIDDFTVIDIRDLVDRQREGHIARSAHIPRTMLEWRVDASAELPNSALTEPDIEMVIVCNDGYSSLLAAANAPPDGVSRGSAPRKWSSWLDSRGARCELR